ncbi:sensor histidine kinase [Microbispora sp. NPDC088329]|uniref:sensor histidine kinase n=1 Tax=Microbispora sp. NPDC088329 TaxID=3154869 RepID=UPI00343BC5AE
MRSTISSIPDVSDWVEFGEDRPPKVFNIFFWASAAINALIYMAAFRAGRYGTEGWALGDVFFFVSVFALVPGCLLWPFLAWGPCASLWRRTASAAFLATSLLLMLAGGVAALLIAGLAVANALAVFGPRGGIFYAVAVGLFHFTLGVINPGQPLVSAIVNGAVVLLLCLVILVVLTALAGASRRADRTRRLLADLEQAHAELRRYAAQTRDLTVAEERARIARDMHDSIGHYLTVINMGLANAQRYRETRPEEAWDEVRQAKELTLEALADTRRWVRALKPLRMEGRTGVSALRALADSFGSADPRVAFTMTGAWPDVHESTELVLYRVLQEGLTNALRHSRAYRIEVLLECSPERVVMTVSDDGEGADPESVSHGYGLRSLRERLDTVGGELFTTSEPGQGFRLCAALPVHRPAPQAVIR